MFSRKEKALDSMEQACLLCRRAEADPDIYGRKLEKQGLRAHEFCLFFANDLFQQPAKAVGLMGFLPQHIMHTVEQAARKDCFVCGESGATITCREAGCDRSFHLPCAVEGGCVTQFLPRYMSFCWEHRPEQAVEAAPEETTTCLICMDSVGHRKSYSTMVCPACKHAWFHRGCIQVGAVPSPPGRQALSSTRASLTHGTLLMFLLQGQALRAGIHFFQCPLCRDRERFVSDMLNMGIRIPRRLPSWENNDAYAALNERHSHCDASQCLCPGGRERAEEEGPWQLLLCCSCAAEGTHRRCSYVKHSTASWECNSCAGLGTVSSATSELAGSSTASQSGLGPSHSSPAPETRSPSTGSQAALGSPHGSQALGTSSPCTGSQAASEPPHGSPVLEDTSCSSTPGPERVRDRSRLQRRAQNPYSRRRRRRDRSQAPAPSADTSTPSQAAAGVSHSSPAPEASSPSTDSQLPSGTSCSSPALQSSSRSSTPGPERVRDRSRLQRRAQNPYSRPRRHNETSRATSPSAGCHPSPPAQ
ncbi:LOW QUALITY PROTEIN: E3 ubiquitin-protein ligase PHF7-like [Balearica regulorum gibbericeps]|uniref:LOW QUALITY PROTEIN: E3 ubiquitin-protein ligase PHF7-like n=1 Tax=Balearica regulorum gibbericeps TaxID=100784 RepID=UPI003F61DA18